MNSTHDHLDDEVLSALLDGDAAGGSADDAAVDAAAHLRACDRCSGRQGELAAARTALAGASPDPVDELTRRRLVAAALTAAPERGSREPAAASSGRSRWLARHPALIGSAAAVILGLLVGVPFVLDDNNGSGQASTTLAAGAPEASTLAAGPFLGDLGDLSDRETLRQRLATRRMGDPYSSPPMEPGASPAGGGSPDAPVASATPSGGGLASTTTVAGYQSAPMAASRTTGEGTAGGSATGSAEKAAADAAADSSTGNAAAPADQAANRDRADADACVAALLNGPAQGGRLEASGTGSLDGRPAIVAVFELSGGRVAFVAERTGCAVLDRFPV
ncbi:MAG TPA: hypothetical protein VEG38_13415 [Acidimicrobiia bacterium]|nr:hypothetical protein [Acidimicrobiia bacterium]